uniref:Uncharacterized protein n=1 Tax=Anguilla anguilla TaxID=7936 RepID=A0A0E9UF11_ANGAN
MFFFFSSWKTFAHTAEFVKALKCPSLAL